MGDIERELQRAQKALEVATNLITQGYCDDAANRLYYAAFHAARASLWRHNPDLQVKTHKGVLALFGRELVLKGKAPEECTALLSRLSKIREKADYAGGGVDCGSLRRSLPGVRRMVRHAQGP